MNLRAWLGVCLVAGGCSVDALQAQTTGASDGSESGDATTSSETGGGAESGGSTVPPPSCGDGAVQADDGETCDDGNTDDSDACTTLCQAPACDDEIRSGDESDIDCGGSCNPCTLGAACGGQGDCD